MSDSPTTTGAPASEAGCSSPSNGYAPAKTKKWCCSYHHDGENWSLLIDAYDRADAEARIAKLGYLRLDGELKGTVRFGWLARAICWIRNAL